MPIEVEGPDGQVLTFPDGTARNEMAGAMRVHYMDFNRPDAEVRTDIGKLDAKFRKAALAKWADSTVAKETAAGGVGKGIDDAVRTLARGTFLGSFADEANAATNAALHTVTGGYAGAPYDETLAYQRAKDKSFDAVHPIASVAGQMAGAVAGGGAALKAAGLPEKVLGVMVGGPLAKIAPAATAGKRIAQGAGAGAIYGGVHGAGSADGELEDRIAGGGKGAGIGAVAGGVAVPVLEGVAAGVGKAADALAPTTARIGQAMHDLRDRFAVKASGGAAGAAQTPAGAAADQVIAAHLARANVTPQELQVRLAAADEATRFSARGRAQNVLAPVDLDPSLQRLASSVARQQPEAYNMAAGFQATRQTGQTQALAMPDMPGLPSRAAMATAAPDAVPMGQFERVRDALRKALQIDDFRAHGHARTAYQTLQAIVNQARIDSQKLYAQAYKDGAGVDLSGVVSPVLDRWAARMADEPKPVAAAIRRALDMFKSQGGVVGDLQRLDKGKQFLDGVIGKYFESPESRNRYLGGVLTELKNEVIGAIDGVPKIGSSYKAARDAFSDNMRMRDALQAGRDVFRDGSDVVADQYRALATDGERKLFRLGLADSYEQQMGRMKRTADVTQVFKSPRVQEILGDVIPKSRGTNAAFADRPERFGRFLDSEGKMIATRDEVLGNSKTAQRLADDKSLNVISDMVERVKQTPSVRAALSSAVESVVNKMFGFRSDTATEIANRLFTADPASRAALLARLEGVVGTGRMDYLNRVISEHHAAIASGGAAAGGRVAGQ